MPRAKSSQTSTTVTSLKHTDTRANIPTEELRDFVASCDPGMPEQITLTFASSELNAKTLRRKAAPKYLASFAPLR